MISARTVTLIATILMSALLMMACSTEMPDPVGPLSARGTVEIDSLGTDVAVEENRALSFSNKRSAYFYTQSHRNDHPELAWFRGLNIAQKRVFSDIEIRIEGRLLDPEQSAVRVYPDRMVRRWTDGVTAAIRLVDHRDIVEVEVTGADGAVNVDPSGQGVSPLGSGGNLRFHSAMELPDSVVAAGNHGNRHYLLVAPGELEAAEAFEAAGTQAKAWRKSREARLTGLLNADQYVQTSDPDLTAALRWLAITTDQLVTRQHGDGIYAGLPWFNEYWGRDSFIALPGALLVTGRFETARAVLIAFAEFMDMDPSSKFYGRVPNRVRPEDLDYHTTDGTPRFVIALRDYVRYSGDTVIIEELYPRVRASIEGALANWTDANGYLTHAENETWMDARRAADLKAYSPRDTRANDIQALWHGQLLAGVYFAGVVGDAASARRWQDAADRLAARFERDYTSPDHDYLADRLDAADRADFSMRPNQFYAFDLVSDRDLVARATRTAWECLVYPWGVASLAADDPFFHPYHLAWDRYHKDEAYHNGTVWLWNNGIAMQRMIELGQVGPAWALFANTNRQVLDQGVVGGLAENMDAWPRPGNDWPRLTGTYLQAWSNTEQLRAWYQYFLGVRPGAEARSVELAPRLPTHLGTIEFSARIGRGQLRGDYRLESGTTHYAWTRQGPDIRFSVGIAGFGPLERDVADGERVEVKVHGTRLEWTHWGPGEKRLASGSAEAERKRLEAEQAIDRLFEGIRFAEPGDAQRLPVMQRSESRGGD